jgi:hypothetical protein
MLTATFWRAFGPNYFAFVHSVFHFTTHALSERIDLDGNYRSDAFSTGQEGAPAKDIPRIRNPA